MLPLPCMLVCSFVCANRTRDRGCSKHPVFPAPSLLEEGQPKMQTSGAMRREIANLYPRHCEPSGAHSRDPSARTDSRGVAHETEEPVARMSATISSGGVGRCLCRYR